MRADRDRYRKRRKSHDRSRALNVNIRLRRRGQTPPTRGEVIAALQYILDNGETPDGWQFAAIDWQRPRGASRGWRAGEIEDIERMRPLIETMMGSARIGIVRRGDTDE